jgi:hypothetical protein
MPTKNTKASTAKTVEPKKTASMDTHSKIRYAGLTVAGMLVVTLGVLVTINKPNPTDTQAANPTGLQIALTVGTGGNFITAKTYHEGRLYPGPCFYSGGYNNEFSGGTSCTKEVRVKGWPSGSYTIAVEAPPKGRAYTTFRK